MALTDILLSSGDQYMELDLPDGSIHSPIDITSDANGIYELPYISASDAIDLLSTFNNGMVSEISNDRDRIQIFIDVDGRMAIRLDNQVIKIID